MNNWCGGSKSFTKNCDAVSILFPAWERAFTAVVQHHLPSIKDENLKARMEQFITEELSHANAHDAYNARAGITEQADQEYAKTRLIHRFPSRKLWLGSMVSIENFAVCMGRMYLDLYGEKSGREHNLFAWHSREEIGHKALAIDLWKSLGYSDAELRSCVNQNQAYVIKFIVSYTFKNVKFNNPKDLLDFARWSWYIATKTFIPMLRIYLPNFHPNNFDDTRYLKGSI